MRAKTKLRSAVGVMVAGSLLLGVAGCGTTGANNTSNTAGSSTNNTASNSTGKKVSGTAQVAYAGSLQYANDKVLAPAFTKATGYQYQGRAGGSFAVANLIKSKEIQPDVFESVGTAPIASLGSKTADWAVGFASSPLVIAYSSKSPFASQLNAIRTGKKPLKDLFSLMEKSDFHLGRTDPATDPQGQSFVLMMKLAEKQLHLPSGTADKILGGTENSKQIFQETDILSRLQAGQLDASSAYQSEAIQDKLAYITLPGAINLGDPKDASIYKTVQLKLKNGTTVTGAPIEMYITTLQSATNADAGTAFAKFVLSKQGLALYKQEGFKLTPFAKWGKQSAIPSSIQSELSSSAQ